MGEAHPVYLSLVTLMGTLVIVSVGTLLNNSRLSDLKSLIESNHANVRSSLESLRLTMDARFAEQKAELLRVEQVMDARLRHLEENR